MAFLRGRCWDAHDMSVDQWKKYSKILNSLNSCSCWDACFWSCSLASCSNWVVMASVKASKAGFNSRSLSVPTDMSTFQRNKFLCIYTHKHICFCIICEDTSYRQIPRTTCLQKSRNTRSSQVCDAVEHIAASQNT